MFSFLFEEGVLTVGTLSGIFTAGMLNSFRVNILEPFVENIVPTSKLDGFAGSLENIMNPAVNIAPPVDAAQKKFIKWQTFLKDFIMWLFIMFFLYIFWKYFLHKFKR
jgi:large-conductance mechanosensitive channel